MFRIVDSLIYDSLVEISPRYFRIRLVSKGRSDTEKLRPVIPPNTPGKSSIQFCNSIEIWLAAVARVPRPLVVPRRNGFAPRKSGPRDAAEIVHTSDRDTQV
jgi:hypothetical protein